MKLGIDVRWLHEAYNNALHESEHGSDLKLPAAGAGQPHRGLGGVGRYLKELLPPLAEILHDVKAALFFLDGHDAPRELTALWGGAEVSSLPENWRPKGAGWGSFGRAHAYFGERSVARRLRPYALDLFFSPHQLVVPGPGWAARRVVTCHDLAYLEHPALFFKNGNLPGSYKALYNALAGSERLIAVSHATAASLETVLGIPAERITVTHEGVSAAFQEETEPYRPGWPYLLHVGGAGAGKNLRRVIEAWQLACDHGVSSHLILCGVTPDQVSTHVGPQKTGTLPGVHCVPPLDDCQLNALYRGAELLLFPSIAEGFGLPVVEAMACGCPVVTSKASPMEEIAGEAALLVDPHSCEEISLAVERLIGSPSLRESLVEQGRRRAGQFTWEKTAEQTAGVLRDLMTVDEGYQSARP
jgi:glycosyltransferase involved in cell wall biosynthesis